MGVLVALTVGLVFWVVAWSLDFKAFDAMLVTLLLLIGAVTVRMFKPFLDQLLGRETEAEAGTPSGV